MNVEIKEIKFKLKSKELSFTIEEAKEMRVLLNELFGANVSVIKRHHHYDGYYPIHWLPEDPYPVWSYREPTCTGSNCFMEMNSNTLTLFNIGEKKC